MKTKFNFTEVKSTEKAILANIEGIEMWLPKSVCEIEGDMIEVAEWKSREIVEKIARRERMRKDIERLEKELGITAKEAMARHDAEYYNQVDRHGRYFHIDEATGKRMYA